MKQRDFLPNLILFLLSGILAASIFSLAARIGLPYTYTSSTRVQLTGNNLSTGDVNDYVSFIRTDTTVPLSTIANLNLRNPDGKMYSVDQLLKHVDITTRPMDGMVDITVRTHDPYTSRDIANEIVSVSGNLYEASHTWIRVNRLEVATAAEECDKRPVGMYTAIGGLIGLVIGALMAFVSVRRMRRRRRAERTSDPRYKKIAPVKDKKDDELFADDDEDVDPEMRELYRLATRVEKEKQVTEEEGVEEDEVKEDEVREYKTEEDEVGEDGTEEEAGEDRV